MTIGNFKTFERPVLRGFDLLLAVLVTLFALTLRLSVTPPVGSELYPGPDSPEYVEMARRLASFRGAGLELGDKVYPSRYPVTFSLMLTPAAWALGGRADLYWKVMAVAGAISAGLLYALCRALCLSPVPALVGALLVALSPAHLLASTLVMSDLATLLLYQVALLILTRADAIRHPAVAVAAGLCSGALLALRMANVPLAGAVLLTFIIVWFRHPARIALLLASAGLALLPELLNRIAWFGSPFAEGYSYYLPSFRPGSGFDPMSPVWATQALGRSGLSNMAYYGRMLAGVDGTLIKLPYALPVLSAIGLAGLAAMPETSRTVRIAVLPALVGGGAGLFLLHLFYYWQDGRMLLALLLPLAVGTAAAVELSCRLAARLAPRFPARTQQLAGPLAACVLAAGLLVLPVRGAFKARHLPLTLEGIGGDLRHLLLNARPAAVVTNLGVIRVRNLLFPFGKGVDPYILSISDAIRHDEHTYRNNRQSPWPPELSIPKAPAVAVWKSPASGGSGTFAVDEKQLRELQVQSPQLIVIQDDRESVAIVDAWRALPGWEIRPVHRVGRVQVMSAIWSAKSEY